MNFLFIFFSLLFPLVHADDAEMIFSIYKNNIDFFKFPSTRLKYYVSPFNLIVTNILTYTDNINGSFTKKSMTFYNTVISLVLDLEMIEENTMVSLSRKLYGELFINKLIFEKTSEDIYKISIIGPDLDCKFYHTDLENNLLFKKVNNIIVNLQFKLRSLFLEEMNNLTMNYPLRIEEFNFRSFIYQITKRWLNCNFWLNDYDKIVSFQVTNMTYNHCNSCQNDMCDFSHVKITAEYQLYNSDMKEIPTEFEYSKIIFGSTAFGIISDATNKNVLSELIKGYLQKEYKNYNYERNIY